MTGHREFVALQCAAILALDIDDDAAWAEWADHYARLIRQRCEAVMGADE